MTSKARPATGKPRIPTNAPMAVAESCSPAFTPGKRKSRRGPAIMLSILHSPFESDTRRDAGQKNL
jgi:hypothetical protein